MKLLSARNIAIVVGGVLFVTWLRGGDPFLLAGALIGLTVTVVLPVMVSLGVHEWAHARMALAFGDRTAMHQGRVTLDPRAQFSLFGMVVLSGMLALMGSPVILGAAKPVPIEPTNFSRERLGMVLVCAAGPASNAVLAAVCSLLLGLLGSLEWTLLISTMKMAVLVNVVLCLVNLLPILLLGGGKILWACLGERSYHWAMRHEIKFALGALAAFLFLPWALQGVFGIRFEPLAFLGEIVSPVLKVLTG